MLGFITGRPGARAFRRHLATEAVKREAGLQVLRDAISKVDRHWMLEPPAQSAA